MKKLIISLLILNFISFGLHAQIAEIDSLENLLQQHHQKDTVRVNLLNEIAYKIYSINIDKTLKYAEEAGNLADELIFAKGKAKSLKLIGVYYYVKANSLKALECFQKSLKAYEELGDKKGISSCLNNIGNIYFFQSNYPKAIEYYQEALNVFEDLGNKKGISACSNNIGNIYHSQGNYYNALEYYQKALKIYEGIGSKKVISACYNNIGNIYIYQDDYLNALKYYQKSLKIEEGIGNKKGISICFNNIGNIYNNQGNYPEALDYFQKALKTNEELGDKNGISNGYNKIGNIYIAQGDFYKSQVYYQKSLKIAIEIGNKSIETENYAELASLYFKQKKYEKAYNYGKKAYKMANEIGDVDRIKGSSNLLAKSSAALGLYKEAYKYHVAFKTMNDSIFNGNNIKELTNLENKYAFDKEKETIATVQAKKDAVQVAEIKHQKQLRNVFTGGAIIFLILAIIILHNLIQKRKANQILASQKEEILAINDKLVELDQFKEGMTGMIVHDLKNPLNAIINAPQSFSLKKQNANMKQSGKQMLNMVLNILDVHKYEDTKMTVDKVDHSLFELSQNAIKEVYFLAEQKNIAITNSNAPQLGVKCDKEVTERIFVNLLTNAIKYTPNNGAITLSTDWSNGMSGLVKVQVTDTGQGIPKDKLSSVFEKFGQVSAKQSGGVRSTGLGLTFCKMAVEAHGGEISVESKLDKGTSFIFTLPLGTEFEKVVANEKTVPSKPKLILSDNDKELLKPYVKELSTLMVYEISNVKKILDSINFTESEFVENWIIEVRNSLFAMNEEKFNDLINQIS